MLEKAGNVGVWLDEFNDHYNNSSDKVDDLSSSTKSYHSNEVE